MFGFNSLNSGDDLYLENSDSQSSAFIGGSEPVTGRHSVILSLLRDLRKSLVTEFAPNGLRSEAEGWKDNGITNPDSVRRVNPPNTTIPKTLAALPRSQYATVFELREGNLGFGPALPFVAVVKKDAGIVVVVAFCRKNGRVLEPSF